MTHRAMAPLELMSLCPTSTPVPKPDKKRWILLAYSSHGTKGTVITYQPPSTLTKSTKGELTVILKPQFQWILIKTRSIPMVQLTRSPPNPGLYILQVIDGLFLVEIPFPLQKPESVPRDRAYPVSNIGH